ncbi:hypothetical protein MRX96_008894 [Rhipicephalus microplus]
MDPASRAQAESCRKRFRGSALSRATVLRSVATNLSCSMCSTSSAGVRIARCCGLRVWGGHRFEGPTRGGAPENRRAAEGGSWGAERPAVGDVLDCSSGAFRPGGSSLVDPGGPVAAGACGGLPPFLAQLAAGAMPPLSVRERCSAFRGLRGLANPNSRVTVDLAGPSTMTTWPSVHRLGG